MSTTVSAPSRTVIPIDAGQVITLAPDASAAGRFGRIGDTPGSGEFPSAYSNLTAGVTVLVGPFIVPTRIVVELSAGSVSYSVTTPNPAYCTLLGKIEPFTDNRTLTAADNGRLLRCDAPQSVTLTVPNNLPEGFNLSFAQWGNGNVTVTAASGATNRSSVSATIGQYKVGCILVMRNADGVSAEFSVNGEVQ
jgi:hypothetical protein